MDKNLTTMLREIKDASGWTEVQLASEIGSTQPTVNRILRGQNECKLTTYQSICALHARFICRDQRATAS